MIEQAGGLDSPERTPFSGKESYSEEEEPVFDRTDDQRQKREPEKENSADERGDRVEYLQNQLVNKARELSGMKLSPQLKEAWSSWLDDFKGVGKIADRAQKIQRLEQLLHAAEVLKEQAGRGEDVAQLRQKELGYSRSYQLMQKKKELGETLNVPYQQLDRNKVTQLRAEIAEMEADRARATAGPRREVKGMPKKSFWRRVFTR